MCEPVDEHDSRGCGFYCCKCNKWFEKECRCGFRHRKVALPPPMTTQQVAVAIAKYEARPLPDELDLSDLVKALR